MPVPKPVSRPYILINMAMSADGKIAAARSHFSRMGSSADTRHLLQLRTRVDGILCGATTVIREQADLLAPSPTTRRDSATAAKRPLRIIATATGQLPTDAPIFQTPGPPIVILTTASIGARKIAAYRAAASDVYVERQATVQWKKALRWLQTKLEVSRLLLEGGGELNQALLSEDLVDEIRLTVCPYIFGGEEAPTIAGGSGFPHLADCPEWQFSQQRRIGDELFLKVTRNRERPESQK